MRISVCSAVVASFVFSQLGAGVVLEMGFKDSSGRESAADRIYAQGGMARIDTASDDRSGETSMIFLGDEMLLVNHSEKTYHRLDEATLEEINSQMDAAMKQMEAAMAQVPPEQRAMMEKMMKGRMKGMMPPGADAKVEPLRVEAGGSRQWNSYSCRDYTVFSGSERTLEICAAPASDVEGFQEAREAFERMAEFAQKMMKSVRGPFANLVNNPMQMINQIDGFPVHTRHFEDGKLDREAFLKSSTRKSLDDSLFAPPGGYKEKELFKR